MASWLPKKGMLRKNAAHKTARERRSYFIVLIVHTATTEATKTDTPTAHPSILEFPHAYVHHELLRRRSSLVDDSRYVKYRVWGQTHYRPQSFLATLHTPSPTFGASMSDTHDPATATNNDAHPDGDDQVPISDDTLKLLVELYTRSLRGNPAITSAKLKSLEWTELATPVETEKAVERRAAIRDNLRVQVEEKKSVVGSGGKAKKIATSADYADWFADFALYGNPETRDVMLFAEHPDHMMTEGRANRPYGRENGTRALPETDLTKYAHRSGGGYRRPDNILAGVEITSSVDAYLAMREFYTENEIDCTNFTPEKLKMFIDANPGEKVFVPLPLRLHTRIAEARPPPAPKDGSATTADAASGSTATDGQSTATPAKSKAKKRANGTNPKTAAPGAASSSELVDAQTSEFSRKLGYAAKELFEACARMEDSEAYGTIELCSPLCDYLNAPYARVPQCRGAQFLVTPSGDNLLDHYVNSRIAPRLLQCFAEKEANPKDYEDVPPADAKEAEARRVVSSTMVRTFLRLLDPPPIVETPASTKPTADSSAATAAKKTKKRPPAKTVTAAVATKDKERASSAESTEQREQLSVDVASIRQEVQKATREELDVIMKKTEENSAATKNLESMVSSIHDLLKQLAQDRRPAAPAVEPVAAPSPPPPTPVKPKAKPTPVAKPPAPTATPATTKTPPLPSPAPLKSALKTPKPQKPAPAPAPAPPAPKAPAPVSPLAAASKPKPKPAPAPAPTTKPAAAVAAPPPIKKAAAKPTPKNPMMW